MALALLAGNRNVVRLSPRACARPDHLDALKDALADPAFAALRQGTAVLTWDHSLEPTALCSAACDVRLLWGGDAAVAALQAVPLRPGTRDLHFTDRFSLAAASAPAWLTTSEEERDELARRLGNDISWFDQQGCSSPRLFVWCGAASEAAAASVDLCARIARQLDAALATGCHSVPCDGQAGLDRPGAAIDRPVTRVRSYGNELTVVELDTLDGLSREHPGAGVLLEAVVADLAELAPHVNRRDQTLAAYGFTPGDLASFAAAAQGVDRITPFGDALRFEHHWDGMDLIAELYVRRARGFRDGRARYCRGVTRLIVVTARGFGREVEADARDAGFDVAGFLHDTHRYPGSLDGLGLDDRVLGTVEGYEPREGEELAIGLGDIAPRLETAEMLLARGARLATVVHPRAWVADSAELAPGTVVAPFAFVGPHARVGELSVLNTFASVGHALGRRPLLRARPLRGDERTRHVRGPGLPRHPLDGHSSADGGRAVGSFGRQCRSAGRPARPRSRPSIPPARASYTPPADSSDPRRCRLPGGMAALVPAPSQHAVPTTEPLVPFLERPVPPAPDAIMRYYRLSQEAGFYSNGGPCSQLLTTRLSQYLGGATHCVTVGNCTLGLMAALRAVCGTPRGRSARSARRLSYTFTATACAIEWAGFEPVFVDIERRGWHIDPASLEAALERFGEQVAGVLACATFGTAPVAEQRARWRELCDAQGVPLLIDSAPGFGSRDENGKPLGGVGDTEIFSFHATKPFSIGEGGVVTTADPEVAARSGA